MPNGDEWHLFFRHFCGGTSIKLPAEKLPKGMRRQWFIMDIPPVDFRRDRRFKTGWRMKRVLFSKIRRVGPFTFTSITFPND